MATLYEYYNTGDDDKRWFYGITWYAQTFTPSTAHKITSVKLKLHKVGSPTGNITVSIRATDGSSHPTGGDLCSGITSVATLPVDPGSEWREITLGAGYVLSADTKYAIVVRLPTGGDALNYPRWLADVSSPTYAGGCRERSGDSGSSWVTDTGEDFMFEDWGEPPVSVPTVTTQAVSDIDITTATGNGTITDNGGENCSKRGVCWNTGGNPTVADSKSEETDSFGAGAFTRPMTGLVGGTHYYVKAYAYNSAGYGYGGQVEFDTLPAITVHEKILTDGIAFTDTLVKTPMKFVSDGVALSDVLVKTPIKFLSDGIAFTDVLVKLQTHVRIFIDGIAFTDTLVKTISKTLTDGIAFRDAISYVKNPTKLAKLIRKLLQLEDIGGGGEE